MKNIKSYNIFINESIRDKMKGKVSKEEFDTYMDNLIADIAEGILQHEEYNGVFTLNECYIHIMRYYYDEIIESLKNSISKRVILDVFIDKIIQDLDDL